VSIPAAGGKLGIKSLGLIAGYTWAYTVRDEANRPSVQYHLDENGNLVVDRMFVYLGGRLMASYEATAASPGWRYYVTDHLGSVRLVTDVYGQFVERRDYMPFGGLLSGGAAGNPVQFAGMERDAATGSDYDHARYYPSLIGRFMAPDLLGGDLSDPQSWNRYSYGRNNPVGFTDPTGLVTKDKGTGDQTTDNCPVGHVCEEVTARAQETALEAGRVFSATTQAVEDALSPARAAAGLFPSNGSAPPRRRERGQA
jgi:RHS repeat-associated protein